MIYLLLSIQHFFKFLYFPSFESYLKISQIYYFYLKNHIRPEAIVEWIWCLPLHATIHCWSLEPHILSQVLPGVDPVHSSRSKPWDCHMWSPNNQQQWQQQQNPNKIKKTQSLKCRMFLFLSVYNKYIVLSLLVLEKTSFKLYNLILFDFSFRTNQLIWNQFLFSNNPL